MGTTEDVTALIHAAADGDRSAYDAVARWAYDQLELVASRKMRVHFGGGFQAVTLEPSDLVHEAFVRLLRQRREFEDRSHFLAFATTLILRVLVDYQRRRSAQKRGGEQVRVTLSALQLAGPDGSTEIPDFTTALDELERLDGRKAQVVKLRVVWGLSMNEIAETVEVSVPTVERDWRFCRAWLAERLGYV